MRNNLLWLIQRHAQEAREVGYQQACAAGFPADSDEERKAIREIAKRQREQSKTWQRIQRLMGIIE